MKTINFKNSMKNILNNVMVAFVALALTLGTVSCKKNKDEDPKPSNPNNNGSNTAPIVSATAVPSSATAPATVTITASASDADGSIAKVQFIKNGTVEMEDVSAPYEYVLNSLSAGAYTFTVKAIDNQGASTTTTVTFTVNTSGGSNSAPTFTGTAITVTSDGTAKVVDIASLVHDNDGNTITIASISPMTGVSNINGTQFTVTPSNNVFAGALNYSVTITDGTDNTTTTVTVTVGSSAQVTAYSTLSNYFKSNTFSSNSTLQFEGTTLTITNSGTMSSNSTQSMFFGDGANVANGTYKIDNQGRLVVNNTVIYTISESAGALRLTLPDLNFFELN